MVKHSETQLGAVIGGDFRIVSALDAGGMGAVYVAEQLSTGALRALKLMHGRHLDDEKLRERFMLEARVSASVPSEHVVAVIAAGIDEDSGAPWLAMELLEGEDLSARMKRTGPFLLTEVRALLQQMCHGLAAAHDAGIVHRDLKPRNIFLARAREAGGSERVKLLDFGVAKRVSAGDDSTAAVGTPAWMSPEQSDRGHRIAPSADVWSLGLLTFWMLTGRSYWLSLRDDHGSMETLLREMLLDPLVVASARAAELGCSAGWPARLDGWFARCVARAPGARFTDAAHAYLRFEATLSGVELAPTDTSVTGLPTRSDGGDVSPTRRERAQEEAEIEAEDTKRDSAPVDSAPVDSAPVDSAPVDSAPVDSAATASEVAGSSHRVAPTLVSEPAWVTSPQGPLVLSPTSQPPSRPPLPSSQAPLLPSPPPRSADAPLQPAAPSLLPVDLEGTNAAGSLARTTMAPRRDTQARASRGRGWGIAGATLVLAGALATGGWWLTTNAPTRPSTKTRAASSRPLAQASAKPRGTSVRPASSASPSGLVPCIRHASVCKAVSIDPDAPIDLQAQVALASAFARELEPESHLQLVHTRELKHGKPVGDGRYITGAVFLVKNGAGGKLHINVEPGLMVATRDPVKAERSKPLPPPTCTIGSILAAAKAQGHAEDETFRLAYLEVNGRPTYSLMDGGGITLMFLNQECRAINPRRDVPQILR